MVSERWAYDERTLTGILWTLMNGERKAQRERKINGERNMNDLFGVPR